MPPKFKRKLGESKQDFLKRCTAEAVSSGTEANAAMAGCVATWNKQQLSALVDDGRFTLSAPVTLAAAQDNAPRTFQILAYTGKLIDWGYWGRFIIDLSGMKLAKAKVPALLNHHRDEIVGTIDQASSDDNGFYVSGQFSSVTKEAQDVLGLADEGFPWQASIGVQASKIVQLAKDATMVVNGQTVSGPCDVWTESSVFETSFCPFGADDDTAAVSMTAADNNPPKGTPEVRMNKKLRKLLEKLGLDPAATEQEAAVFMAGLDPDALAKELAAPVAAAAPVSQTVTPAAALSAADVVALQGNARKLGITDDDAVNKLALECATLQDATVKLVDLAAAAAPPVGNGRFESGKTEMEKVVAAMTDALLMRCGVKPEKPCPGATELRGLRMIDMGAEYLSRAGVSVRGLYGRELAGAILGTVRLGGMHSTSDFPNILANVAAKVAQKAYAEAPSTWQAWCSVADGMDFKPSDRPQLSDAPSLDLINESGEYTFGSFSDFKETNQIKTYGKAFSITRQAMVNDDLGMLTRIPRMFGAAGTRLINDLVYAIITTPQTMGYDSVALFHASHANLAGTGGALASTTLDVGRQAVRKQTGPGGAVLNLTPKFLLVPAALETTADVLLRSMSSTDAQKNSGVINPWVNSMTPVVEARLDKNSATAWYMVADNTQIDTVEVMFLDGVQAPVVEEVDPKGIDGSAFYVRLDVGARALDHRGFYKNPGA